MGLNSTIVGKGLSSCLKSFSFCRGSLMKAFIPDKTDDMFTNKERQLAPEGLIRMFLEREENAKRLETKTGNGKN